MSDGSKVPFLPTDAGKLAREAEGRSGTRQEMSSHFTTHRKGLILLLPPPTSRLLDLLLLIFAGDCVSSLCAHLVTGAC